MPWIQIDGEKYYRDGYTYTKKQKECHKKYYEKNKDAINNKLKEKREKENEKDITFQKHEDTSNVKKCVEVIEGYFKCHNCKDNICLEDCDIINFDYVKCYDCKEIFEWFEE